MFAILSLHDYLLFFHDLVPSLLMLNVHNAKQNKDEILPKEDQPYFTPKILYARSRKKCFSPKNQKI